MAKPVTLSQFQQMQRGEGDALGDAEIGTHDVAIRDPLTGGVMDADPFAIDPAAEDAAATARLKEIGAGSLGTNGHAESEAESGLPDWRQIATTRAAEPDAGLVVDVSPDGTVAEVRAPEMTPDRGPEVGTTVHTITDDEPRFSGGGAHDASRVAPWTELRIPSEAAFGDDEFINSTALAHRAEVLTERHPDKLDHLNDLRVIYLWKKAGGKAKGRGVYGKTTKPSGLLKKFSEATFVIWLAADHCRGAGYTERQIEALLFHEMLHTGVAEPDEETGRGGGPVLIPHELEIFRAEVEVYGLWAPDLREVAPAFDGVAKQASLFDAPVVAEDEAQHEGAHEASLYDPEPDDAEPLPFVEEAPV